MGCSNKVNKAVWFWPVDNGHLNSAGHQKIVPFHFCTYK